MNKNKIYKFLLIVIFVPIFFLLAQSIIMRYDYTNILPSSININNFTKLFSKNNIILLLSSIILSLTAAVITVIISLPISKLLSKYNINNVLYIILMLPILIPQLVYVFGIHSALTKFHLNNTLVAVLISHIIAMIPYAIFNLAAEYNLIGDKYEEVAKTMGADDIKVFFDITFPLMKYTMINTIGLLFIISFSQYFLTLIIGGGVIKTYAIYLFPLIQSNDRNYAAKAMVVYVLINIIIYLLIVKFNRRDKNYENN